MKQIDKKRLSLFWYRDGAIFNISDSVAIHQLYQPMMQRSEVVFRCRPGAEAFMTDPSGTIEVRYACVVEDNPESGELIVTIQGIELEVIAVDDMTTFLPVSEEMEIFLRTKAVVKWEFIDKVIGRYIDGYPAN